MDRRPSLTRESVLRAAMEVADSGGVSALSMRSLARHLGVEAMSLYHYVANKDDLLDGMVDLVFAEIDLPRSDRDWAVELRRRSLSAREVLGRHPWAVALLDSRRSPGPATLRHRDAVIGCLRAGGFSVTMAAHAFALLDAHLYGFVIQETSLPLRQENLTAMTEDIVAAVGDDLPALTELAVAHVLQPGYSFATEFEFGLDLILEGLDRRRATSGGRSPAARSTAVPEASAGDRRDAGGPAAELPSVPVRTVDWRPIQ